MPQMELTGGGWTSTYGITPARARRMFPGLPTSVALTAAKERLGQASQVASRKLAGASAPAQATPMLEVAQLPITATPPGENVGAPTMGTSTVVPMPPLPEGPTAGEPQPAEVSREPAPESLESFVRSSVSAPPTTTPKAETPAPQWRQVYTPPPAPKVEPPAPPPPEVIKGPVPVEGVAPAPTERAVAPVRELPKGAGGFEREVPIPVGFSLPTPERLAEIWREVTGRAPTEEEQRYFASPQFQRVLAGRIPMWMAADPIWRRFFQLVGLIRKRLEE